MLPFQAYTGNNASEMIELEAGVVEFINTCSGNVLVYPIHLKAHDDAAITFSSKPHLHHKQIVVQMGILD